jgi:hypothetical protein
VDALRQQFACMLCHCRPVNSSAIFPALDAHFFLLPGTTLRLCLLLADSCTWPTRAACNPPCWSTLRHLVTMGLSPTFSYQPTSVNLHHRRLARASSSPHACVPVSWLSNPVSACNHSL